LNNHFHLKGVASALALATAASGAAVAHAQTVPPATPTPSEQPADAKPSEQAKTDDGIGDIVVTARRRVESLQKAAIAIDAVGGDALVSRGVSSAGDLTKAVPALSIPTPGGAVASIFIRGVGNITTSSYNDPAVTPSYDGVVLGRGGGVFGAAFYDLARVEVLKGPQGILYGRNATGGAVNVIPARPEIGNTSTGFNLSYGNYNAFDADAYVNIATGANSALRLAGSYAAHDAYNKDGTDDAKRGSLRGQFLIEPSDNITFRVGADYTHIGGQGVGGSYVGVYVPNASGGYDFVPSGLGASEGFNTPAGNAFRQSVLGAPGFGFLQAMNNVQKQDLTYWGVNAELNWKTGLGTLTVIPAYRESADHNRFYGPAFNVALTNENVNQRSLEARLAGKVGPVDYVVGGFYFHEKINADDVYNQEFVLPIQRYLLKTDSLAAFGQLTFNVTHNLRLTGGARYTRDKKSIDGLINNFITFCGGAPDGVPPELITPPGSFAQGCAAPAGLPRYPNFLNTTDTITWLKSNGWIAPTSTDQAGYQLFNLTNGVGQILKTYNPVVDSGSYSRVTWKASAELDLSSENLLYATVETGYRAGGFQLSEGKTRYNPEFITAYTIGSKNRFFNNKVQLNLEAFIWKYRDQQITYFTVDTSGTLISSSENAGRSTIKGFDVDLIVKPFRGTTLSSKVQYLDSHYDDLHLFTAAPRDNFACPFTFTGAIAGGAPVKDFNCSGNQLLFSPKWTLNLGAEQAIPLTHGIELVGNVSTAWRDSQWGAFEFLAFERIPAYWTTDLGLTIRKQGGGWAISGFVYNLENKRRDVAPQASPIGVAVGHYTAPRTYGVRLSGSF
jgi:iron complex outermembrane receptor protein